jgi:hypothetical protein
MSDSPSSKRRRLDHGNATGFHLLTLDCLVHCLQYLEFPDLNNVGSVSKTCRQARGHSSLDLTRAGTIHVGRNCITPVHMLQCTPRWNQVFQPPRTHLRIEGIGSLSRATMGEIVRTARYCSMPQITSLDISVHPDYRKIKVPNNNIKTVGYMLPNLRSLDLSYTRVQGSALIAIVKTCPQLRRVTWKGAFNGSDLFVTGQTFRHSKSIRELYLQDCVFYPCWSRFDRTSLPLLSFLYDKLERVDIKGATSTFTTFEMGMPYQDEPIVLPQDFVMAFVRAASRLQWFRSDLIPENVAILKQERPEITFC